MQQMGLVLSNKYSAQAYDIMGKMGYKEGKGLGRYEQGPLEPASPNPNKERQGLGFS